jgi:hypothetical protein
MLPRCLPLFILPVCLVAPGCGPEFKEFSPDGKFKVQMPGTPKEQDQSLPGRTDKSWAVEEKNGTYYVSTIELPALSVALTPLEQQLDGARDGAMRKSDSKLTSEQKIALAGKYPGRHVEADIPATNRKMKMRFFIVGTRLYLVLVFGTVSWMDSANTEKFLNSLELIGEPDPAKQDSGK